MNQSFRPMRAHNPNGTSIGSAVFAQTTAECLYCLQWFACFPLKIVPSHVGIWTSCNMWFIGPTWVQNANDNLIVSAIFAGLTVWHTDRATERATDRPRYPVQCGIIMRNYVGYGKANNFATINFAMCTFKTFNKTSRLNSYIWFGSVHCSRQSSNRDIYVVPVYHLNTGIEEPININISLNRKNM